MSALSKNQSEWVQIVSAPRQVLLVEDSVDDSIVILEMSKGFYVDWVVAHSFAEAVEHLRDCQKGVRFSLIVLDLHLNGVPTGKDLFFKIKNECPFIPILVLSGNITTDTIYSMSKAGFVMFAPKPPAFTHKFFQQFFCAFNIPMKETRKDEVVI